MKKQKAINATLDYFKRLNELDFQTTNIIELSNACIDFKMIMMDFMEFCLANLERREQDD